MLGTRLSFPVHFSSQDTYCNSVEKSASWTAISKYYCVKGLGDTLHMRSNSRVYLNIRYHKTFKPVFPLVFWQGDFFPQLNCSTETKWPFTMMTEKQDELSEDEVCVSVFEPDHGLRVDCAFALNVDTSVRPVCTKMETRTECWEGQWFKWRIRDLIKKKVQKFPQTVTASISVITSLERAYIPSCSTLKPREFSLRCGGNL